MENVVDYYRRKLIRRHQTRTNLAELLFVLYVAFLPPNVYSASIKILLHLGIITHGFYWSRINIR